MAMTYDDAIRMAAEAIEAGELVWGEALIRGVLEKVPGESRAMELLVALTKKVGQPRTHDADRSRPRFLLIKSWGKGFWSDVDHVLGGLLAAEMTGRTPIVHWGANCLFTAPGIANAWEQFFEPINGHAIDDVARDDTSFFPPKWSAANVRDENVNVWQGPGSRVTGVALLNRPEDVVVCDFHVAVPGLMPWIEPGTPHDGQPPRELYRELFARYLHPRQNVFDEVEAFHAKHLAGAPYIAVHWRGSDKYQEQRALAQINEQAFTHVESSAPDWKIFLLTDDARAVAEFHKRYGQRVVLADAERSSNETSVHGSPASAGEGARRGREVLRDTLLAARADRFIGNGGSNVAAAVVHLKNWDDRDVILLSPVRQYRTMPVLYRPRV